MAMHNPNGSTKPNGVEDNQKLKGGASQELIQAGPPSMLDNPGTDGANDRAPNPVPMYPYGHEGQGSPLFELGNDR